MLFAWRLFFFKEKRPPSIEGYSTAESDADSEIWSIDGDRMTDREPHPAQVADEKAHSKEAPSEGVEEEHELGKTGEEFEMHRDSPESTSSRSLKSVSHLLATDVIPEVPSLNLASTSFSSAENSPQGSGSEF